MISVPIHRLTEAGDPAVDAPAAAYTHFAHPYDHFVTLISHVHPGFVICDAVRKLAWYSLRTRALAVLYPDHNPIIDIIQAIWHAWTEEVKDT
jgi:hypothetical protein